MRIVIALGGNALLQRGQPMTADNQRANIRTAAECIAEVTPGNEIIIAHGNGPQVGLLALQAAAYHDVAPYPLDVLGAQTEAMIGYVIEQELGNLLPAEQSLATLLTMIEVDRDDPAFDHPTKPIGPVYDRETAERLKAASGCAIAPDGDKFRRVVASPKPKRIFEIGPIRSLVEQGTIVICAGGGGIPTMYDKHGHLHGVEAVIDKDLASALLAEQLDADLLVIVSALADPPPRLRLIDRFLVAAYDAGLEPVLCLTKADLAGPEEILPVYEPLGLRIVVLGRPLSDEKLADLRYLLAGKLSVLVGHSGVGKSTLVNTLIPEADRAVGEVSPVTGRGRHTSSSAVALPLPGGGWIIDTPGLRSFGLGHMSPERVVQAFPDLADGAEQCPRGCDHLGPECALDDWIADGGDGAAGRALAARLDSLRRLLRSREGPDAD